MALDVTVCPDINNNGAGEIAVLGMRPDDGRIRVWVKDAATDEVVGALSLPKL